MPELIAIEEQKNEADLLESIITFIKRALALLRLLSLVNEESLQAISSEDNDLLTSTKELVFSDLCSQTTFNDYLRRIINIVLRDPKMHNLEAAVSESLFTQDENRMH